MFTNYKVLLIFLLFILSNGVTSQIVSIDNSQLQKGFANPDTVFVRFLAEIGREYMDAESDSCIYYFEQAIKYGIDLNYTKGELQARFWMATHLTHRGDYAESLRLNFQNEDLAQKAKDYKALFFAQRQISRIYRILEDYKNSREYLDKIWTMLEEDKLKDTPWATISLYYNESQYYADVGDLDSARIFAQKAYDYGKANNEPEWLALGSASLAEIYKRLDQTDSAFVYFRISSALGPMVKRNDLLRNSMDGMANLFLAKNEIDSALFYANQVYRLSIQNKDFNRVHSSSDVLSRIYAIQNQYDSAYNYALVNKIYSDSLEGNLNISQAIAISRQIQDIKNKKDLELAEQEYQSNLRVYFFAAGLLILILVIFFILRVSRQHAKSKEKIEKAYADLKSAQAQLIQAEKMASLGELTAGIAHEIQNPLNFVNNFSEVSSELVEETLHEVEAVKTRHTLSQNDDSLTEIKDLLIDVKSNLEKITHHGKRADAIVKGMLAHSRTGKGEKTPTDINALAKEYLRLSYHGLRAKDKSFNADFKSDFDPDLPKTDVVQQDIGRVLLNLINNAFQAVNEKRKKAEPGYKPEVSVETRLKTKSQILITIRDNGPGIPDSIKDKIFQPFFTTKPTGQGTGLGLSLSYDIVKAHGGELRMQSSKGITTFTILLPSNT